MLIAHTFQISIVGCGRVGGDIIGFLASFQPYVFRLLGCTSVGRAVVLPWGVNQGFFHMCPGSVLMMQNAALAILLEGLLQVEEHNRVEFFIACRSGTHRSVGCAVLLVALA